MQPARQDQFLPGEFDHPGSDGGVPDQSARARIESADATATDRVPVLSVIDGDTIRVSLGGVNEPLRLIGIDTAESGDECFDEATAAMSALVAGKTVRIDVDVSNRDSFGRLLRYVFLADGTFVNAELVEAGWATAANFPPDSEFAGLFVLLEGQTQATDRGQWDTGGCDELGAAS